MRRPPTAWHLPFGALVEWRCPKWIEVALEVLLQRESQRIDQLYTLRAHTPRDPNDRGEVLRGLWEHIPTVGVAEYKSVSAPFARGDLYRLLACGWHWLHRHPECAPEDLVLVLLVATRTPTLDDELARCGASLSAANAGYWRGTVRGLGLVLVDLDVVGEAERDDYVRAFGLHAVQTPEVVQWLRRHTNLLENTMLSPKEVEGHEDLIRKIAQSIPARFRMEGLTPEQREEALQQINPAERLRGLKPEDILPLLKLEERLRDLTLEERLRDLTPEERLRDLTPEERLRDLSPEEAILALPDAVLRGFSEEYLATLSERVRKTIRKRLRTAKTKR
jgi:hypothetical protein